MNNQDRYKAAFSKLHASKTTIREDGSMLKLMSGGRKWRKSAVVGVLAASLFAVTAGAANLATGGELLRKVQLYINGEQADVEHYIKTDEKGRAFLGFEDADGNMVTVTPAPGVDEKMTEGNAFSIDIKQ